MLKRIVPAVLAATLALAMPLGAYAAVFDGYRVTVTDSETQAVTMRGRTNDAYTMLFVSADGGELGAIAYNDYQAISRSYGTMVPLEGGGSLNVPPAGYEDWHVWFAEEFNGYRGLNKTAPRLTGQPGDTQGSGSPVTAADRESARQFYAGYDLTVYDWEEPAVLNGSYIVAGMYDLKVFYAADGRIIGVIDGDSPLVEAQQQIDSFNAYRGLPSTKLRMVETKSLQESGIGQYEPKTVVLTEKELGRQVLEAVRLTNEEREKKGVRLLELDENLMAYAQMRAEELAVLYSHTRPEGAAERPFPGAVKGENIHRGYSLTAERAINSWVNSPGHYRNMMKASAARVGIGFYQAEDGTCYWVQLVAGQDYGLTYEGPKGSKYA